MEAKQNIAANDQEKFDPPMEWAREDAMDTLLVYLPGFSKERIKVQTTSTKTVRISGERSVSGGPKRRFEKEFEVPSNCDSRAISASFVEGILYVKLPKTITPAPKSGLKKLPTEELAPDHPQPKTKNIGQENAAQQGPKTTKDQAINGNTTNIASPGQKEEPIGDSGKEVVSKMNAESKKISSRAAAEDGANHVTQKTLEKDKDKGLVDEEKKSTSTGPTGTIDYIQEIHGKLLEKAKKRDKRGKTVAGGHGKDIGEVSRLEGLVVVAKKPNRLINYIVGLLFAVVFVLFLKDTIFKSFKGESKRAEL